MPTKYLVRYSFTALDGERIESSSRCTYDEVTNLVRLVADTAVADGMEYRIEHIEIATN